MNWTTLAKRTGLTVVVCALAFTWTQTGRAQAPCLVERGIDPLDVLNSGVRHNVWLVLDTSGSMRSGFGADPRSKLEVAQDVLNQLMGELVDGSGKPLVNWGFVHYAANSTTANRCGTPDNDGDFYPDLPRGCVGLDNGSFVDPAACGGDSRALVRAQLNPLNNGNIGGLTPIGTSFDQVADYLTGQNPTSTDFVATLLPNQKNFIIQITDGQDTCECNNFGYAFQGVGPDFTTVPMRPDDFNSMLTNNSTNGSDRASYNAGIRGDAALVRIDPALDGSKGNTFVLGVDLGSADKARTNTVAWMASGVLRGRDPALTNSALFADDPQGLVNAMRNILAKIGIPSTEVTLGSPIVASVKEVISSHTNPAVTDADVFGDVDLPGADFDDVQKARRARGDHRFNVLFETSVEVPSFRGHLKAVNLYTVTDPNFPTIDRASDFTEIWDAGDNLQAMDPVNRNLLFNKRGDAPGTAARNSESAIPACCRRT